ncbi:hypothetical protein HMPREF1254_1453 [Prevotella sp. BV3P1]|nr:hypothetical protein HMPREF1254_1453 [Prevotella sp. BV3P1]
MPGACGLKISNFFTKKRPKNGPSQFSFWRKTIGLADENKELFCLEIVVFVPKTMILPFNIHHFATLEPCN